MKLHEYIEYLEEIALSHGDDMDVIDEQNVEARVPEYTDDDPDQPPGVVVASQA